MTQELGRRFIELNARRKPWKAWWERERREWLGSHSKRDTRIQHHYLGGGFNMFFEFFTPIPGEMIQFDEHIFQMG